MNTEQHNRIPFETLKAAALFVGKKDVREHLNYVIVKNGNVYSTNGHCLFKCEIKNLNKEIKISVPASTIRNFGEHLIKNELNFIDVKIENSIVFMTLNKHTETFINLEHDFLNYEKILEFGNEVVAEKIPFMNYEYIYKMQKANKILKGDNIRLKITENDVHRIKIEFDTKLFKVVGLVSAIKEH